jgi:hypothetical protein
MKIINNVLNNSSFDLLQKEILANDFPWYFLNCSASKSKSEEDVTYSFHHTILDNDVVLSSYFPFINLIALQLKDIFKLDNYKIFRLRFGLTLSYGKNIINNAHIDEINKKHKVILLYINDSDGDTYFYENNKIINSITPEKNKAVLFDGDIYHSSSKPLKNSRRIVLNINLEMKDNI